MVYFRPLELSTFFVDNSVDSLQKTGLDRRKIKGFARLDENKSFLSEFI